MKKIILASNSPQRKKLLKNLGLKFQVFPSRVEELKKITTTCEALVKDNALLKARDVAVRLKKGIVIGADTVVYIGDKSIVGKPRDHKDARRILKILFSRPQWVYTGLALIDASTGKTIVGYEKTRVFMIPLSDKEIDLYHKRVDPFDKAGGFDIEGWGSIFIHRIEGCYSNVIGLPMAKLAAMLKKFGVSILGLLFVMSISGCTTEYNLATKKEETTFFSTEKEVKIGDAFSQQLEQRYKVLNDFEMNERTDRLLKRIVQVCDRKDVVYFIRVLDDDEVVNALSLPGGYVYLFSGLVKKMKTDDELAGVIAHEIGHITARHAIKRLQASYGALLLQIISARTNAQLAGGVSLALSSLFSSYSQDDEFQADSLSVKYLKKAGFRPEGMPESLQVLEKEEEKEPLRELSYWRTHPHLSQRISAVNQVITGKLEFKDYLNLIGNE